MAENCQKWILRRNRILCKAKVESSQNPWNAAHFPDGIPNLMINYNGRKILFLRMHSLLFKRILADLLVDFQLKTHGDQNFPDTLVVLNFVREKSMKGVLASSFTRLEYAHFPNLTSLISGVKNYYFLS